MSELLQLETGRENGNVERRAGRQAWLSHLVAEIENLPDRTFEPTAGIQDPPAHDKR